MKCLFRVIIPLLVITFFPAPPVQASDECCEAIDAYESTVDTCDETESPFVLVMCTKLLHRARIDVIRQCGTSVDSSLYVLQARDCASMDMVESFSKRDGLYKECDTRDCALMEMIRNFRTE